MKRFLTTILLAAALGIPGAMAQEKAASTRVITGAVIDKNGNPLPGATVSATGGAETTTTDADGTFQLEVPIWLKSLTATYPGMRDKKLKTNAYSQMLFTMKPTRRLHWFIDVLGGVRWGMGGESIPTQGELGLMGGFCGKWGVYAKVMLNVFGRGSDYPDYSYSYTTNSSGDIINSYGPYSYNDYYDLDVLPTVTVGVMKSLGKYANVFLGGGVAWCDYNYSYSYSYSYNSGYYSQTTYDYYSYSYPECEVTGTMEAGAKLNFKHVNAVVGLNYIVSPHTYSDGNMSVFFGVGYNF